MQPSDRVLVVDDQEVICEVLRTLLRREGFEVETASDGEQALRALGAMSYEVMVLDKNLPGLPGLEVLARARSLQPDLEIILITAYASLDSALAALRGGANDYLIKPFADLTKVGATVRRAAERARRARANRRQVEDVRDHARLLEKTLAEVRGARTQALAAARQEALADAAARLSQELREPLARLRSRLEAVAAGGRAEADHRTGTGAGPGPGPGAAATPLAGLDPALAELAQVERTVAAFLEYALPRAPAFGPCDPVALVRESIEELTAACRARRVELGLALPSAAGEPIELDASGLRLCLGNLLRNALDAMPEGGSAQVALLLGPEEIELQVADGGPGLSPEALARAGRPFYSTKPRGAGLGLALARRFAEDHGGRLELGNRPDGPGACVRVVLPRRRPRPPQLAPEASAR